MLSPRPVGQKETIKSSYICEFLNKIQKKYNKYQDWFKNKIQKKYSKYEDNHTIFERKCVKSGFGWKMCSM